MTVRKVLLKKNFSPPKNYFKCLFCIPIFKGMAYVAQHPWLQHGTLRENILWGEIFDESRYRRVIWACALHKDIEDLGGDNIDIGENGSSLSGGQKARVALARAVYQDKQSA